MVVWLYNFFNITRFSNETPVCSGKAHGGFLVKVLESADLSYHRLIGLQGEDAARDIGSGVVGEQHLLHVIGEGHFPHTAAEVVDHQDILPIFGTDIGDHVVIIQQAGGDGAIPEDVYKRQAWG